jgi:hypothetical protein
VLGGEIDEEELESKSRDEEELDVSMLLSLLVPR